MHGPLNVKFALTLLILFILILNHSLWHQRIHIWHSTYSLVLLLQKTLHMENTSYMDKIQNRSKTNLNGRTQRKNCSTTYSILTIINKKRPNKYYFTVLMYCKKKVKWSRYRPGVAQRVGTSIAVLFHDRGTRRGWVVSSTPRPHFTPGKDPVPILQEVGWAPRPVWKGGKSRPHRDSIPERPARSQSLYRLSYPAHINPYRTNVENRVSS